MVTTFNTRQSNVGTYLDLQDHLDNILWPKLHQSLTYLPVDSQNFIKEVFYSCAHYLGENRRQNGELLIEYKVEVCLTLAQLGSSKEIIAAYLIYDLKDQPMTMQFGLEVNYLAQQTEQLRDRLSQIQHNSNQEYTEVLRRMFIANGKDIRVLILKLVDRLHHLKTLDNLPNNTQMKIVSASLAIDAQVAERVGLLKLRQEIEEMAFRFNHISVFRSYESSVWLNFRRRQVLSMNAAARVRAVLEKFQIRNTQVEFRAKRYYSIYKKSTYKGKPPEDLKDLVAVRVICKDIPSCYQILDILHRYFQPYHETTEDYIQFPKPNGYQSLHSTVLDLENNFPIEIQVRTNEMHEEAEFGRAAHFYYKDEIANPLTFDYPENLRSISRHIQSGKLLVGQDFDTSLNLYTNKIYVQSAKGQIFEFNKGVKLKQYLEVAYDNLGVKNLLVRVNQQLTNNMNQLLQDGDLIEIVAY